MSFKFLTCEILMGSIVSFKPGLAGESWVANILESG